MKLFTLFFSLSLGLMANAEASPTIANPGEFPEYYCGNLSPERFVGAPASASGNSAALEECASRFAMAEAELSYGKAVKFNGLKKTSIVDEDPSVTTYIFVVESPNGKLHSLFTRIQADSSKIATDGNPAIIIRLTPLGICEGTNIDSCG